MTHSPRPWKQDSGFGGLITITGSDGSYVCSVQVKQAGPAALCEWEETRRKANADLICAANTNSDHPQFTLEEIEKAISEAVTEPTRLWRESGILRHDVVEIIQEDVRNRLQESRKGGAA